MVCGICPIIDLDANSPEGEYQDRRDRSTVNCSNTIWILATNAHDSVIQAFCSANHEVLFGDDNESEKLHLAKTLSAEIRHDFLSRFGVRIYFYSFGGVFKC